MESYNYYAEDATRRFRFAAWSPPPAPGDELCRALTGRPEAQLVRDILDGEYDHIFAGQFDRQQKGVEANV